MKLLTKELEAQFEKQGSTAHLSLCDIFPVCKWFNPLGAHTWYVYEQIDEDTFMCFANLGDVRFAELGTVSLSELESIELPCQMGIERDLHFRQDLNMEEICEQVKSGKHV